MLASLLPFDHFPRLSWCRLVCFQVLVSIDHRAIQAGVGAATEQRDMAHGALIVINITPSLIYLVSAYRCSTRSRPTDPSHATHASRVFRGKADPFQVSSPNSQPPFLFHDKSLARWRMPTGAAGEGANPQVRGYLGLGVPWGTPARGFGYSDPTGTAPGGPRTHPKTPVSD